MRAWLSFPCPHCAAPVIVEARPGDWMTCPACRLYIGLRAPRPQ